MTNIYWFLCKVPVGFVIFAMNIEFYKHIFKKYRNVKFHENTASGSRVVPCWKTHRRDEVHSRF